MPIEVTIPSLLRDCAGNRTSFDLEAATLDEALRNLRESYPLLRLHLYDEAEQLRPHVLLYYNADNIAWLNELNVALQPGDTLTVLQNVSGG
jgi:molybdopterin converting factor small subunit